MSWAADVIERPPASWGKAVWGLSRWDDAIGAEYEPTAEQAWLNRPVFSRDTHGVQNRASCQ
jgi:hypothetical protein